LPTDILQEIGSYAGLAAVVGLAVLSALYFSQARDVKRLREWAGRGPERSQEQPTVPPATPAGRVVAQPQQQAAGARPIPMPGGAQTAAASATGLRPATAAGQAGAGQATQEHDALAADAGEDEPVGVDADTGEAATAGAGGETGEHDAPSEDGTGEHEVVGENGTGDGEAVGVDADEDDAVDDDTGEREAAGAEADGTGEHDALDEDEELEEDEELAEGDEDLAPPEGEPAVAAGDTDEEDELEETGEREPVGAQARSEPGAVAQSGLAAPPATAAGGMAAGAAQTSPRPAPPGLPSRPMPARPGPAPTGQRPPGMPPGGARASQTAIIPPPSRAAWYRTPRYLVLAIAGVLIVGGGAAFGVVQLTKDDKGSGATPAASDPTAGSQSQGGGGSGGGGGAKAQAAVDPKKVTVAVLNGTTVPGLAAQIGDKLGNFGFQLGNITNSTDQDQGRAESAVLYAPGHKREALAVSRKLRIDQREQIDAQTQGVAGDATVVVIAGIDQTR
jgi:hypothetical protein